MDRVIYRNDIVNRRFFFIYCSLACSTPLAALASFGALKIDGLWSTHCEAVWPSGKALGWSAEGPRFDPLRLSFLFSSKIVVYGHCLVTLPRQLMKH